MPLNCRLPRIAALLLFAGGSLSAKAEETLPKVPEGFVVEKVASSPLVRHPMMGGFDDRGRLFIAASAGSNLPAEELLKDPPNYIQLLEDADGDGHFDKSTIFAEGMTLPMGGVWYRGSLYVASPPSIWRLQDTDGDGKADRREELVDMFGFTGNAASIHGCFLGPTGRIYWVDGRHGHTFTDEQGRVFSAGRAARIFSCRPDGGGVETFAGGGMDNPVEVDFTPEGEMLGTANIMLSQPRVDTLVHWIEGGVYPRSDQEDCIAEFKRTGDLMPPLARLGHVAVSGMTRYRSEHFGPDYRDNVFIAVFNTHSVVRSVVERSGATFQSREEEFLVSPNPDFHPTDVIEDADGSLLVIDTGGWFRIGCPTSQVAKPQIHGAIYRVRRKNAPTVDDPRGLGLALGNKSPAALARLLNDPRPAVKEQAVDLLARRGDAAVDALRPILESGDVESRRNAVWSLSRMESSRARSILRLALGDESESVRLAAVHSLGTLRDPGALDRLAELVVRDTPAISRESATALGRICEAGRPQITNANRKQAVDVLHSAMRASTVDRFLEHALLFALIRIAERDATLAYLGDANPAIRRAALVTLDQMDDGNLSRNLVLPLLDTDDPALQEEALAIIGRREGWAGETLRLLRRWLSEQELTGRRATVLRGFLLAQAADPEIEQLVAETLGRENLKPSVQLLLLEIIDRAPLAVLPPAWIEAVGQSLAAVATDVQLQAVRIVQSRALTGFDDRLQHLAGDEGAPAELRIEANLALAPRTASVAKDVFAFLVDRLASDVSPLAQLTAARALAELPLNDEQLVELTSNFDAAGPLAVPVLLKAFAGSESDLVGRALVSALERSASSANLSADELSKILVAFPERVQTEAEGLLARLGVDLNQQRAELQALAALTSGGNAEHGRAVFYGKKAACFGCHTINGKGGRAGPDLTTIGRIRTGRDLLEAIAYPSATFAREFRTYMVVTDEGRVHSGVIGRQTADSIYLRTAELAEIRVPRAGIVEMRESSTSLMPKGMHKLLSDTELRDLLAYLQSLR